MKTILLLALLTPLLLGDTPPSAPAGYSQNFEKLAEGKPPEEILILSGDFLIKKAEGNAFIELAGDPLDSQGFLTGSAEFTTGIVSARIQATSAGKRFPEFGIGAGGPSGYKLWIMPALNQVQITRGEQTLATAAYPWSTGQWTRLKFQARKADGGKFRIEGKAWPDGKDEPKDWSIGTDIPDAPPAGKATFWCTPYSGTPTRFDDLLVTPAP